ncbi:C5a anaphylatoxin chemotactic receptor 1-like [Suncus etruscus]|uniref:C5a anaphylatoxin chemotactic receptor 1-like n=1 Tax=Suncus etruscus TaxID=109475 RepID=UPI0021102F29|nr:C5a anaphylatoxin chemotactic receptor 1-like [Suncus etruscus]
MNVSKVNHSSSDNISLDGPVEDLNLLPSLQTQWMVAMVIYIVVFVVGVPGNALVLWVTVSETRRSVNAIWFLNLAVADLLSCLALPIHIMTALKQGNWLLGDAACHILIVLFFFNLYASVILLTTISAYRFLMVYKPIWCQKYRVARRAWQASGVASGVAWMLALVLSIPYFVFGVFFEDLITKESFCDVAFDLGGPKLEVAIIMTLFVLTFLVPLVTMSVCYTLLLLRTWRRKATRSTKTLKVVVAVVTSFFVFWLPYQLSNILLIFYRRLSTPNRKLVNSLYEIGMALALVNCCINPIIYVAAARGLHIRVFKFRPGRLRQLLTED